MALPIPSMGAVHAFFSHVVEEVDAQGKKELSALAAETKVAIDKAKVEALKAEAAAAPDIQAAVQNAFALAEQYMLQALAAHGL